MPSGAIVKAIRKLPTATQEKLAPLLKRHSELYQELIILSEKEFLMNLQRAELDSATMSLEFSKLRIG
ncbi:hypothetical protein NMY22_g7817 [Coprinellus aureogranulatus]|nr:hypothetical protein NMY22_g7817 [Coprinellus aureogranulatus]